MNIHRIRTEAMVNLYDKRNERIVGAIGRGFCTLADAGLLVLANNVLKNDTVRIVGISLFGLRGLRNAAGFVLNTGMAIYDTAVLNKAINEDRERRFK